MGFIVTFSSSNFQYITPRMPHYILSVLFWACKPGFGVGYEKNFTFCIFYLRAQRNPFSDLLDS